MISSFSVVLPCFNGASTLGVQLAALSRQRWREGCEVLFVDNGSTDGSLAVLDSWRDRLPPVRVIQAFDPARGRQGVASSYALAIEESRADALLLCEADDEVADDWFEAMAAALEEHEVVAAAIEYRKLNPPEVHPVGGGQQSVEVGLSTMSGPLYLPYASGCSLGFRRSVAERIGPPDPAMGAAWDTDWCWRAELAGIAITFVPETCVHYRLRHQGGARFRQGRAWSRAHGALARKHGTVSARRATLSFAKRVGVAGVRLSKVATGQRTMRAWMFDLGWAAGVGDAMVDAWKRRLTPQSRKARR